MAGKNKKSKSTGAEKSARNLREQIDLNISALEEEYTKELLDFTFTLLEKQEREKQLRKFNEKDQSRRNKDILAKIKEEIQEQKDEQDALRSVWKVSRSFSDD